MNKSKEVKLSFLDIEDLMKMSVYDTDRDGIVDVSQGLQDLGVPDGVYYGKENGVLGFYKPTIDNISEIGNVNIDGASDGNLLTVINNEIVTVLPEDLINTILPSPEGKNGYSLVVENGSYKLDQQSIFNIKEVSLSNLQDGQSIVYDASTNTFINKAIDPGTTIESLSDISDVSLFPLNNGDSLVYDNGVWSNKKIEYSDIQGTPDLSEVATSGSYNDLTHTPELFSGSYNDLSDKPDLVASINDLLDVNITSITAGQMLEWDGNMFIPVNKPSAGGTEPTMLGELSNVNTTGSSNGDVLTYNNGSWVPRPVTLDVDYNDLLNAPVLSEVATSGSYNDLTDKPVIPEAFSGNYNDLTDTPDLFSGDYNDLTNKPDLKAVATSGSYNDLTDKPVIPEAFSGNYNDLTNRPDLFSGSYNDLTDKPVIPEAFSGNYNDLTNRPDIPTSINDLLDVNIASITAGQILEWDGSRFIPTNKPTAGGTEPTQLGELSNVNTTGSSNGDVLGFNGSIWTPVKVGFDNLVNVPDLFSGDYNDLTNTPDLKAVATSGSYNDLTDKPVIPEAFSGNYNDLTNRPDLFSGSYNDLTDKPVIPEAFSGNYNDLTNRPDLFSGSYNDLTDKPVIPEAFSGNYNDLTNKPDLKAVATSGSYNDLTNTPSIPSSLRDLNDVAYLGANQGQVLRHNGTMFNVATLSYNDLSDTPTIPEPITSIGQLNDVTISGISNGQVLQWNGNQFVPATVSSGGGGASSLNELSDVNTAGATNGQFLGYDGSGWKPMIATGGGSGGLTVEMFRVNYAGNGFATGPVDTSDTYSNFSSKITPILIRNGSRGDFITEIVFNGYNYPPISITMYGFDAGNNRYEIRPLSTLAMQQYLYNFNGNLINPDTFGSFQRMRISTADVDTGASPKTGLPTTPAHAWIVMLMGS